MPVACPRLEVRSGYAARTAHAERVRPFGRAQNPGLEQMPLNFCKISVTPLKLPEGYDKLNYMLLYPTG